MLRRTFRVVALAGALAAVGAASLTTAAASAFVINLPFTNVAVSGTLTPKKLNQPVALPEGSNFNGQVALELPAWSGPITGNLVVPPFTATIPILGVPTTVGLTLTQVGTVEGAMIRDPNSDCPGDINEVCLTMSVPTHAILGITKLGTSLGGPALEVGVTTATECETSEPLTVPLSATLTLPELLTVGAHFSGTITIPPIRCNGLSGVAFAAALTAVMSGPDNPYALAIAAPTGRGF
jgi:hypothetical protein